MVIISCTCYKSYFKSQFIIHIDVYKLEIKLIHFFIVIEFLRTPVLT